MIFDEVHERNLPTDVGLALCLDARKNLRTDLRVLAMSATADTDRFAKLLGDGEPAPIISSAGRQYPVDITWAPPGKHQRLDEAVADVTLRALRENAGDILVFLPGIGEINRVQQTLERSVMPDTDVYPLAGALSLADQDRALAPSPAGRRRVVLSTDIAETSLTVNGVSVVVDSQRFQLRVRRPNNVLVVLVDLGLVLHIDCGANLNTPLDVHILILKSLKLICLGSPWNWLRGERR